MEFTVDQAVLKAGLDTVGRATARRTTLPVLECVLIEAKSDGLHLSATDLELGTLAQLTADIQSEGAIAVPAKVLAQFVGSLPAGPVSAKLDKKSMTLKVRSGKMRGDFKGITAEEFPIVSLPEASDEGDEEHAVHGSVTLDAQVLREAIQQVVYAAAPDLSRPTLAGALLEVSKSGVTLVATDGYRLAKRTVPMDPAPEWEGQAIVPTKPLKEVASALKDVGHAQRDRAGDVCVVVAQGRVAFMMPNLEIVSQLIEGTYPDYHQIIREEDTHRATLPVGALSHSVHVAGIFAGTDRQSANPMKLKFSRENVEVSARSEDGFNNSALECALDGEDITIAVNPRYLADILGSIPTEKVVLGMVEPNSPITARPMDGGGPVEDLVAVAMPMYLAKE